MMGFRRIFAMLALLMVAATTYAQHTYSRNETYGDYSSAPIGYKFVSITDTAGSTVDTIDLRPAKAVQYYRATMVDSADFRLKSTGACYYGDILQLDITNSAISNVLYLDSKFIVSTGTNKLTLTASKSSMIRFWFDGANYVEMSRNLNYTR